MTIKTAIISFIALFILGANQALAHGSEEHAQQGLFVNLSITIMWGSAVLFLVFAIFYVVIRRKISGHPLKKKKDRDKKNQLKRPLNGVKWAGGLALVALILSSGYTLLSSAQGNGASVTLKHIHGLGYTNNGEKIFVPSHNGLRVFSNGKWHVPEGPKHDYMGFSMVDDGFYSSGHPAQGSNMVNPFGIVRSTDGGKTLETLAFKGETDFHYMDVGYQSHVIFVYNPGPNSKIKNKGFYYSTDNAQTWKKSAMKGMNAKPSSLAVHPKKENVFAMGTGKGVYLSKDFGDTFEKVLSGFQVSAIAFSHDGKSLLVAGIQDGVVLYKVNLSNYKKKKINVPTIEEDAISYIAQNPQHPKEITITTFKKDIYMTKNNGETWHQIADNGKGMSLTKE